jgi:predicted TIM-barrel fold metal-dependent hydrolase
VIAYRTGLAVRNWEEGIAKRSWGEIVSMVRDGKKPGDVLSERNEKNKSVYDTFLMTGLEEAGQLRVPLQIHTGMGDSPSMDLRNADPSLLYDLLQNPVAREASIVLTHGGYPYMEEAVFLTNAYPNVYIDLSETIPFISVGLRDRLLSLLEMAPTTKIMYGSDGFNIPELYWFSAIQAKRALASTLDELIRYEGLGEDDANCIGESFLAGNARRLYRL